MKGDRLADMIEQGYTAVSCRCELCAYEGLLPLPWLAEHCGPAAYWPSVRKRLRCSNCRARNVTAEGSHRIAAVGLRLYSRR